MPIITIPSNPVPALDPFNASVEYTQDQNAVFASIDIAIDDILLDVGDLITFNGTAFRYNTILTSPTDFTGAESFANQFNSNPDFSIDYVATSTAYASGIIVVTVTANNATAELDITASRQTLNADTIELLNNTAGKSSYSKNDISNFAQLARITGTLDNNEQVNNSSTYYFELSSQIQSQLTYYDIQNANGTIFLNDGSFKSIGVQFGTRRTESGSTYRIQEYGIASPVITYLGKYIEAGKMTKRTGSKISSPELYEVQSFLLSSQNTTTTLKRFIQINYTDGSSNMDFDGSVNNPQNGIVSLLSYVDSFSSMVQPTKIIKSWRVSLAGSDGSIIYQGQEYLNLSQACVSYFQVLFTNEYGGLEVVTFKTDATNSFTTDSQESKEAYLPNQFKEFNFITNTTETISIAEQSINEQEYEILKGLPQSKYTYIVDGFDLKPVRLTAYKLNENSFNGNFKCLG